MGSKGSGHCEGHSSRVKALVVKNRGGSLVGFGCWLCLLGFARWADEGSGL
jgi:hypothetical protein